MRRVLCPVLMLSVFLPLEVSAEVAATISGPSPANAAVQANVSGGVCPANANCGVYGEGYPGVYAQAFEGPALQATGQVGVDAYGDWYGAQFATGSEGQLRLVPGAVVGPPSDIAQRGALFLDAQGNLWLCTASSNPPIPATWVALNQQGPPAGAVMFFNLAACPSGWTELTAARGRTVVGRPSGGTLGGTVGTALTNLENRAHNHAFTASVGNAVVTAHSGWTHYGYNDTGTFVTDTAVDEQHGDQHNHAASGTTGSTADVTPYLQLLTCQKD